VSSLPRPVFTAFFIAIGLWCAYTVVKPEARFGAVKRFAGRAIDSSRTRRIAAGLGGLGAMLLAVWAWNTSGS
jgi:hypothetical protein